MLLLRAGIGMAQPASPRAVARTLHISVARQAPVGLTAVFKLRTAARERRCGITPQWVHVPARDRLVLVDSVLTSRSQPARATRVSGHATASGTRLTAIPNGTAKLSFTMSAATLGAWAGWNP